MSELQVHLRPGFWAIDTETCGVDASDPASFLVGIGFANDVTSFYVDVRDLAPDVHAYLVKCICESELTAFNVLFDGCFLAKYTGEWNNWVGCSYGLFKQLSGEGYEGQSWSLETAQLHVLGWQETNKDVLDTELKARSLSKGNLYLLPPEIVGRYCCHDTDAALQLWTYLNEVAKPFPQLLQYHKQDFLNLVKLVAEQQFRGIMIDQEILLSYRADLDQRIQASMKSFLSHPDVAYHIEAFNREAEDSYLASEPPRYTKEGSQAKRWEAWVARKDQALEKRGFNTNSKPQLCWLFYEKLGCKPLKHTPTGRPVIDRKVLPSLGEPGNLLANYNKLVKEMGYVKRLMEKTAETGVLHPQFNSAGTLTGRLGGSGGFNLQQQPKTKGYLKAFKARPGYALVEYDFPSMEPKILAEYSKDESLWKLYGPNAKENDLYLYVAAKIPGLGDRIRDYYDPDNPTPESIEVAKKHCKRERSISKTVCLAANYNAGAPKIHETLVLGGIDIDLASVRKIHRAYWQLFRGVKKFEEKLQMMWRSSNGWIPSSLGIPLCISEQLLKDAVNRFCQASSHQILMRFLFYIQKLRIERKIEAFPWTVDFHDETIWEVKEDQVPAMKQLIEDALQLLTQDIKMEVNMIDKVEIGTSLADFKG